MVYFLLEIIYLDLGFYILSGIFDMVNLVFGLGFTELAPLLLAQVYKPNSNTLASLGATLVRNYDPLTHLLTDRGKV